MEDHQNGNDAEEIENAGRKRGAERQMRKEEDEDDNIQEEDSGSFRTADEATLAQRRKVKVVRRTNNSTPKMIEPEMPAATSESSSLVFPTFNFSATKTLEKKEENVEKKLETPSSNTTQPASSQFSFQTSFTFSSSLFPSSTSSIFSTPNSVFAPISIPIIDIRGNSSPNTTSAASIFGENIAKPSSVPSGAPVVEAKASPTKIAMKDQPVSSGEENETNVFHTKVAKLYILEQGTKEWKERGKGNLKLNVAVDKSYARLIMRVEGSGRLILNVALFPLMKVESPSDKRIRFTAPHLEKPSEVCGYLIVLGTTKEKSDLVDAIEANKGVTKGATNPSKSNETTEKLSSPTKNNK